MKALDENGISLVELEVGEKAIIAGIEAKDKKKMSKLLALGVLPGMKVKLLQKFPSFVFKVGNTKIAADESISRNIMVRKD
ncbi:MAG: ferrous iron transport protein A [Tepidanaerobacteraceae bacterium]|jgi:Fe2+ transport system protein FeoA|nr:ferrous iron transport protein A [Tepidanaerobacteraceae bacterium]